MQGDYVLGFCSWYAEFRGKSVGWESATMKLLSAVGKRGAMRLLRFRGKAANAGGLADGLSRARGKLLSK